MGLSGRVPRRIDAATKHALLGLVDGAVDGGWTNRAACRYLEVSPRRVERWRGRLASGATLDNLAPGGNPVHGLTPAEEARDITKKGGLNKKRKQENEIESERSISN